MRELRQLDDPAALIGPILAEIDGGEEARYVREAKAFIDNFE